MGKNDSTPNKSDSKGKPDDSGSNNLNIRAWQPVLDKTTTPPKGNNGSNKK